jgi:hypothetical protein
MVRRVCIVEGVGVIAREKSVYLCQAMDRDGAIQRILELARQQDRSFVNGEGERTRWAVTRLETVDDLGEGELGDREVFSCISDLAQPDSSVSFDTDFRTDGWEPGRSGVT